MIIILFKPNYALGVGQEIVLNTLEWT